MYNGVQGQANKDLLNPGYGYGGLPGKSISQVHPPSGPTIGDLLTQLYNGALALRANSEAVASTVAGSLPECDGKAQAVSVSVMDQLSDILRLVEAANAEALRTKRALGIS